MATIRSYGTNTDLYGTRLHLRPQTPENLRSVTPFASDFGAFAAFRPQERCQYTLSDTVPQVSIYGALGSYTAAPDNKKHHFALRHYFEPESRGQYLVRLTATLADKGIHDQKVIDVKYQSEDSGDCQRVFEREVEEMTVSMRTGDVRTALENILRTQQQTRPAVNGVH